MARAKYEYELTRVETLEKAREIAQEYANDSLDLTLRQLYYQFVALGLFGSGDHNYKRLGDIINSARLTGDFPLDVLVDRGRSISRGHYTRADVDGPTAITRAQDFIREELRDWMIGFDRWVGQETFVSVWVEKEALAGVFEPICNELGVSWFACKGYPSTSSLWEWLQRAHMLCSKHTHDLGFRLGKASWNETHRYQAQKAVILYFGDHDPDGWEIPRAAERTLRELMKLKNMAIPLTFNRIGLNMDQIRQYNPPSFEAKVTSTRYNSYVKEHNTEEAWELDALNPRVLRGLVQNHVNGYFDSRIFNQYQESQSWARLEFENWMMKHGLDQVGDNEEGEE